MPGDESGNRVRATTDMIWDDVSRNDVIVRLPESPFCERRRITQASGGLAANRGSTLTVRVGMRHKIRLFDLEQPLS